MVVTSSPSITIRPWLGSIRRLIIFSVVVLPQPDGPTNITVEPAGISRVRWSTAGLAREPYCLVTPSSRIGTPVTSERASGAVFWAELRGSDTETSRGGQAPQQGEEEIEDEGHDDHSDDAGEHRGQSVGSAQPGEP